MKPRTWTALFAMALSAWVGLTGLLQQEGATPVVEAYAPAAAAPQAPTAPIYAATDELHTYLADLAAHGRMLPDVAALEQMLSAEPLLVDVRDAAAYAAGHIPGAVNIPLPELAARLDQLPADQPIVVNCGTGLRSAYAAAALEMLGFVNVYDFAPGFVGWAAAGEPISTAATTAPTGTNTQHIDVAIRTQVEQFFAQLPADAYGVMNAAALEQLMMQRDALVIDLRDPSAFASGRIPGSVNIPLDQLSANLERLPFDRPVVLSCNGVAGCGAAAPALHMLGFANVRVFPPSFAGWEAAHLLVER